MDDRIDFRIQQRLPCWKGSGIRRFMRWLALVSAVAGFAQVSFIATAAPFHPISKLATCCTERNSMESRLHYGMC